MDIHYYEQLYMWHEVILANNTPDVFEKYSRDT